ncbi:UNVERIFIED_CONTAM: hypothetical protein PYX00_002452 [Menopon gallinae]|uniref:SPRY domain-containing protein 7 n=1 Tax=Menopon gallinae TaxID=328185 RepID=A0AAW2IGJ2_9NEOP
MSVMFCCLRNCFEGMVFSEHNVVRREPNPIVLDTAYVGHEVVIIKNGQRMCGSGGCLASAPLVQNKSYFEVKLQQSGVWGCGVATRSADLNTAPGGHDSESWVLCSDLCIRHSQNSLHKVNVQIQEGDIIGIWYDHVELNFSVNGKSLDCPVTGIKGTVFPALYVDDGAILDIVLDNFSNQPPSGYDKIMIEQSLL